MTAELSIILLCCIGVVELGLMLGAIVLTITYIADSNLITGVFIVLSITNVIAVFSVGKWWIK